MKKKTHTETKEGEPTVWAIRAGEQGSAHRLFIENSLVVLAKQGMDNLQKLPQSREGFYASYKFCHRSDKSLSFIGIGSKFFRFIHEVCVGHIILYPCLIDKQVYFGEVAGEYFYDESDDQYPHRRKVVWRGAFPKMALSEAGRKEIGAARTFFRIRKSTQEVQRLMAKHC